MILDEEIEIDSNPLKPSKEWNEEEFQKIVDPRFNYRITTNEKYLGRNGIIVYRSFIEMMDFCRQYCRGKFSVGTSHCYFELENDMVLFKIQWS